jgi:lysophospholipid acyltransferase (LPLAT)-like uncharacterized protein
MTCWHGEILLAAALVRHLGRASELVAPMVREYGTPRAMARFIRWVGLELIYIPPYEAGEARREAMTDTLIPLLRSGKSLFFAADGHRAPAHVPQDEPLWLARAAGVPLLPFACAATPALTLPTWDRKRLPLPNSHVAFAVSGALAEGATPAELAETLATLGERARGFL